MTKVVFSKTFIEGNLEGITIHREYFSAPDHLAVRYACTMRKHSASGMIFGSGGGSRYTISNVHVEV